jgi:alkanesulfonate monooxygenase SsuD/methylene tetrahydromethanopterin reductase-like flavin-dependent oxidoreductase (luciferase family)
MKLALYLPNFRDEVSVKELVDLTELAEDLDFDSVWTLDRIVVPEASDREELVNSFGMMEGFPKQLPVSADPLACCEDIEGAYWDEHHRHAVSIAGRARS